MSVTTLTAARNDSLQLSAAAPIDTSSLISTLDTTATAFYSANGNGNTTITHLAIIIDALYSQLLHQEPGRDIQEMYRLLKPDFIASPPTMPVSVHKFVKYRSKMSLLQLAAKAPASIGIISSTASAASALYYALVQWHISSELAAACKKLTRSETAVHSWSILWLACIFNHSHKIPKACLADTADIISPLMDFANPMMSDDIAAVFCAVVLGHVYNPALHPRLHQLFDAASPTEPETLSLAGKWSFLFRNGPAKSGSFPGIFETLRRLRVGLDLDEHFDTHSYNHGDDDDTDDDEDIIDSSMWTYSIKAAFYDIDVPGFIYATIDTLTSSQKKCEKLTRTLTFYRQAPLAIDVESATADILAGFCGSATSTIFQDAVTIHFCTSDTLFKLLEKNIAQSSNPVTREYTTELYTVLARNIMIHHCDMVPFQIPAPILTALRVPHSILAPSSKFPGIDIVFETIDHKGDILKNINASQLLCLAVCNLERRAAAKVHFAQDAVHELTRLDCALSLPALCSSLLYFVSAHLMRSLLHTEPVNVLQREFDYRVTPPLPARDVGCLAPMATSASSIVAGLEATKNMYMCVPLLVKILQKSLVGSLASIQTTSVDAEFLKLGEARTVFAALLTALDLAALQKDAFTVSLIEDCIASVGVDFYGTQGTMALIRLAGQVAYRSLSLFHYVQKIIARVDNKK